MKLSSAFAKYFVLMGALFLLVSCGKKASQNDIPAALKDKFMESCLQNNTDEKNKKKCTCVLEKVFEQLSAEEKALIQGDKINADLEKRIAQLTEDATKSCL